MYYYMSGVLVISWLLWVWETYLDYRQYRVYLTTNTVPKELEGKIDNDTFRKSKAYSIDKAQFHFISSLYGQIQFTLTLCYYLMPFFWEMSRRLMTETLGFNRTQSIEWEIFQSLVFVFLTSIASTFINLPVSIYNTFVIEERNGFNKQTAGFYAWDKTKKFFVSYLITAPVVSAAIYIIRNGGDYFFLYLWMFLFVVVLVLTLFHGEIAAIFDKLTPLPAGELRNRIQELAMEVGFPLSSILVVEGSKRSSHSNAYLAGSFNRRRIVIYDTLIEDYEKRFKSQDGSTTKSSDDSESDDKSGKPKDSKEKKGCDDDEIIAVLCHEIGHWYHNHIYKGLAFAEINYLLVFLLFSRFYKDPALYSAFGFYHEMPAIIGLALFMMILTPYNEIIGFCSTLMTRHFEYQADEHAMRKGHAKQLKTALIKLTIDNLSFPVHDKLYSTFNHSHPTVIQRIRVLNKSE